MGIPTAAPVAPEVAGELDRIVGARAVRAVFQPLVDLDSGDVVAYEALARGPAGSPLESPAALFDAAYGTGRVAELDWACQAAAFQAAAAAGLDRSLRLFVNCEPVSLGVPCPDELWPTVDAAERRLRVVMEVSQRARALGASVGQGWRYGRRARCRRGPGRRGPPSTCSRSRRRSRTRRRSRWCRPSGSPSGPPRTCSCP